MSLPITRIRCTRCDYEGVNAHRPIRLLYRLPDGRVVRTSRDFGWCPHCQDVADIEPLFNPVALKLEVAALEQQTRRIGFLLSDTVRRLLRRPTHPLREDVENLLGQLQIAESRRCGPRCLTCGKEGAIALSFDASGYAERFEHPCGGRLVRRQDPGTRYMFRLRRIVLDIEGHFEPAARAREVVSLDGDDW